MKIRKKNWVTMCMSKKKYMTNGKGGFTHEQKTCSNVADSNNGVELF